MANDVIKALIAEAYGEGPEGMRRVAETILNRSVIRGLTPEEVVRQRAQFTGLTNPGPAAKKAWDNPDAVAAAEAAWQLAQDAGDPTGGADHYYAQNTIDAPWWAASMTPKGQYGGHTFLSSRPVPPGELPEVATARSTVPTPRAPVPATPSIDMDLMRRSIVPSQLIPDTMGRVNRPERNLGDEIGMSPIPGGKQRAPLFDAGYDERTGEMRLFKTGPADTQGVFVGSSRPPAPIPAMPSPQLAARRATDPALQAALNARYPARLPPLPPSTRSVSTTTVRPSASDLVRGNPMQTRERSTLVASIPTRPQVSASDLARGRSGISTIASIPTSTFPTSAQIMAATGFRAPPAVPDRLPAGVLPPALYGSGNVAGVGTNAIAPLPFPRPQLPQIAAAPKIAPRPFNRPIGVGTQLSIRPVPPMPIPRPPVGMGGPVAMRPSVVGVAPVPMPRSMRPSGSNPLRIVVQRSVPPPLYYGNPLAFGARATSQSGDDSVGSQADAAEARASGSGGRINRY